MTTHTDLIARLRAYPTRDGVEAADAIEALEQQVAALTKERDWLSHKSKCLEMERASQERYLAAAQAREAKLLKTISDEATAIAFYGDQPPQWMLNLIALPTDDSALMERLKEERERAVREYIEMLCHDEGYWCFVCGRFLPANEEGVIVHDNVPHPEEMTFDEEERPQ